MSQILTLELDDEVYAVIEHRARSRGTSAARWLAAALERSSELLRGIQTPELMSEKADRQIARERFERHFGEVDLGSPTGAGNEGIDSDLVRAYTDSRQSP